jgi:DNA-binding CsgD family transcriptional regulator
MDLNRKIALLTPGRRRIFFMLFEDIQLKEIAYRLGIAKTTLDITSHRIYTIFGTTTRIGLILQVLKETKGLPPIDNWNPSWYNHEDDTSGAGKVRTTTGS